MCERPGVERLVARQAEHDAFASARRRDLLPERSGLHVHELVGMMDFARLVGRTTVFTLPSPQPVEDVGPRLRQVRRGQTVDGCAEVRQLVEVLQIEHRDRPLLAVHLEAASPFPVLRRWAT